MDPRFPAAPFAPPYPSLQALARPAVPTVGRIVLVRLSEGNPAPLSSAAEVRPAIIVRVINDTQVNLQVFMDGPNDSPGGHLAPDTIWLGTVDYAPADFDRPRTWHWPPRARG